jgi:signal transduction histidine kinase
MMDATKFLTELSRTQTLLVRQQEMLHKTRLIIEESKRLRQERAELFERTVAGEETQGGLLKAASVTINKSEQTKETLVTYCETEPQLDGFYKQIIRAQENERSRIARELHDEFGQAIVAIRTEMEMAMAEGLELDSPLGRRVQHIKEMLEKTGREIQRLAYDLRPTVLNDFGLIPALSSLAQDFTRHTGINVKFNLCGNNNPIPSEIELTLYRIAQEALTNVAKHSFATQVQLTLWRLKISIELVIEDNGIGFNTDVRDNSGKSTGMGLLGMKERLRLFGGKLTIDSSPGRGTELHAHITV